ncbi:DUF4139 domain-containing protein [Planomicrobium sp. CPCC 101110]|uniref:DUF4139 domain-containing protein n=1 Tax=Planomicrobium sp. CPCC 101110 TaxID=2599619 RepID=UPI0011B409A4|nr:DUF4139 domain-containing protein [Planomicrobium sp. CPCC 101110]TWT24810.1 DUF4139 domain-containing protein [Planomicrobium sp. CPCC 101110]
MKYQSTAKERISLSLTVYHGGFCMVKEVRRIGVQEEIDEICFTDIARGIEAGSVLAKGFNMLEQRSSQDLLNKSNLLEKYIGQEVAIRKHDTGEERKIRLLSIGDGLIGELQDTKEVVIDPKGELVVPPLPESFFDGPALVWKTAPGKMEDHIKVSYLAEGIEWQMNYIAEIKGTELQLMGWLEIRNDAGIDFIGAALKLMAGKVYRQPRTGDFSPELGVHESSVSRPSIEGYDFRDRHTYRIGQPVTLLNGQTTQIAFLEAHIDSFRTIYEVDKWSNRATIKMEFDNKKTNGLGVSLASGKVKLYSLDTDKELEFIGEDAIGSVTEGEAVSIRIGEAFNIRCNSYEKKRWMQEGVEYITYCYDLANGKEENVRIHIHHSMDEPIWTMESSSHDYEIRNAGNIMFIVRTAAKKEVPVEFTYRVDKR